MARKYWCLRIFKNAHFFLSFVHGNPNSIKPHERRGFTVVSTVIFKLPTMSIGISPDIARIIFSKVVKTRNEDRRLAILKTFTNAFALPAAEVSTEYHLPVFEHAKDIAHIRMNATELTDIDAYRSRNYTVFIDIETPTGTEEYCMHLIKYLNADDLTGASLTIMESLDNHNKYTGLMGDAFRAVYPEGLVDKYFVRGQDVLMGYHEHTDTYEFFDV